MRLHWCAFTSGSLMEMKHGRMNLHLAMIGRTANNEAMSNHAMKADGVARKLDGQIQAAKSICNSCAA